MWVCSCELLLASVWTPNPASQPLNCGVRRRRRSWGVMGEEWAQRGVATQWFISSNIPSFLPPPSCLSPTHTCTKAVRVQAVCSRLRPSSYRSTCVHSPHTTPDACSHSPVQVSFIIRWCLHFPIRWFRFCVTRIIESCVLWSRHR